MKKVCVLFIIFFLIISNYSIVLKAENIKLYTPTKEELGGEISIPNINGSWDQYTDIDTYEKLYSVLEELSVEYKDLLEKYNNSEQECEELNKELEELKLELENRNEKNLFTINNSNELIGVIVILVMIIIISYKIGLNRNHNK